MANYEVLMNNNKTIRVENADTITVNNETYFLSRITGTERLVIFSAPVEKVYYIKESN